MKKIKLFSILAILLMAVTDINAQYIDVASGSMTISSNQTCTMFSVFDNSTLTINQGVTLTLNISDGHAFNFFDNSKIELHGTLTGSVASGASWFDRSYINVYLSDGAKYTVTGLTCEEDFDGRNVYLVYYGYDAATDGNGTVSVKNGSTDVTSTSTGYKATSYTFTATPGSGYKFKNWTKGAGGEVLGTDASINVTCEQNGQYQVYANFEEFVAVTGVTLSQSEAAMTVGGEAVTLTATVAPDDATDKTVTWTSSDPTVATVANGVVTAVAAGTATITATATNGTDDTADDKTATCTITVTDPDQEAADAVLALFDALPAVENITLDNKEAIEAARAAYDALTDEQKALVTPEDLAKLTAAEEALAAAEKAAADQVAADAVLALFDALPADITLEDKAAIEAARAAYDALTDEQKALVTPEDLAKLTAAEEALAALIKEGVENVQGNVKNVKIIENGQIYILRGEKVYTLQGQEVK